MRFSTLGQWLQWMESCHPSEIELGLDRIAAVAARLALDFSRQRVVTIAGTNGKGSCVATLNRLLQDAGQRVGAYTSPHFLHFSERIAINGQPADEPSLLAAFARVDAARQGVSLSYFEFSTLAALDLFARSALDVLLLEVGLGGRLDAVNIIDPDIAVVTGIALDHTDWLGADREQIGTEKAGIFRAGKPAVCADIDPPASIAACAERLGAPLYQRGRDFDLGEDAGGAWRYYGLDVSRQRRDYAGLVAPSLPLPSVAAALQVLQLLAIPLPQPARLDQLALTGRFQRMPYRGAQLILDVAHNPEAAELLALRLAQTPCRGRRYAIFAVMADKDCQTMLRSLAPVIDHWMVCALPGNPRARAASSLAEHYLPQLSVPAASIERQASPAAALAALDARLLAGDQVIVWGSFFTVADVMQALLPRAGNNRFGDSA